MVRHTTRTDLRHAAAPIWQAIYRHPFILEVGRGTLPREKFRYEYLFWDQAYRLAQWPA